MKNKGVSPVVGTILLIAITVALAAVVATLVNGLGGRRAPPSTLLEVTAKVNADNNRWIDLTVTYDGGDELSARDLQVWATAENGSGIKLDVSGAKIISFDSPIRVVTYDYGAVVTENMKIDVWIVHTPSKATIYHNISLEVGMI